MEEEYQFTIEDVEFQKQVQSQPHRYAYIDECGSFGFDFSKSGNSKYYILCAVIVEDSKLDSLHSAINAVKQTNGFGKTEMKSSSIGNDVNRRNRIISQLLQIDFRIILLIADKQQFVEDSPLSEYKPTFIKYLHRILYENLYHIYPKLCIIEDEVGTSEFQTSFKKYIAEHRPISMFNDHYFDYTNSKDEIMVQLADIISGSIMKSITENGCPDYMEMLKGKIMGTIHFPNLAEPYWGSASREKYKFNSDIYALAIKCSADFIDSHKGDEEYERRAQVAFLRYLRFQVQYAPGNYIYSDQIIEYLSDYLQSRITKNFLFRRIVAQLRDEGVIIASCKQGYKIPISLTDIVSYLNATHTIVSPMLHRVGICRNLIKQCTNNELDILDDAAFLKYKKYFD